MGRRKRTKGGNPEDGEQCVAGERALRPPTNDEDREVTPVIAAHPNDQMLVLASHSKLRVLRYSSPHLGWGSDSEQS